MTQLMPRVAIERCPKYVQGQSKISGVENPIKLSSNESPFGPSPKARQAYLEAVNDIHRYPDGTQAEFCAAVAETFHIDADRIIGGNGSEEVILLAIRAFVDPGDEVLVSENGFVMTRIHALAQGANVVVAPETDWKVNVDNMLAKVTPKTRLVAVANPNNPTGTYIPGSEIRRLRAGLPQDVLLLLDSAYADYVVEPDYECGLALAQETDNTLVTRTFSKLYGLAGIRIGWGFGAKTMVHSMQRIRTPFNTNVAALAAATSAVRDQAYADMVRTHTNTWRERMRSQLMEMGIDVLPSVTNFILLRFPKERNMDAQHASDFLIANGILPRPTGVSGPGDALRVTIGTEQENIVFLDTIRAYVQSC